MSDGLRRAADDAGDVGSPTGQVRLRGFAPSAGAGASLVAAAIALLLFGAALLGTRVWPGGTDGDAGRLTLPATPAAVHHTAATHRPAHRVLVVPAAAAPARVAHAPARHAHGTTHRRATPVASAPRSTATPAPAASSPPASSPPAAASSPAREAQAPAPSATPVPTATPIPTATRGAVERTVVTVRHVAAPVTDALPPAVQPAVQATGDALQQTAATVDQALAPVTDTVDQTLAPITGALQPHR